MIVRLVLWNLADSKTTIHELRRHLRDESVDAFADAPGLVKLGRVALPMRSPSGGAARSTCGESSEAAALPFPSRARELIGKEPDIAEEFDVEATIEGDFDIAELSRRGLAFGD